MNYKYVPYTYKISFKYIKECGEYMFESVYIFPPIWK